MLLGVISVQMELLRSIDQFLGRPHSGTDDYDIKKQLISECLYGVDIKEWAVRIAELRLWLYMIVEADFPADVLRRAPLLPNLDFKLRQGNSLLQKFGNLDFTVADLLRSRKGNTGAKRKLREFIQVKKAFVTGTDPDSRTTAKALKQQELAVFDAFLTELMDANERRVQQLGVQQRTQQGALFNTGRGRQAPLPLDLAEITALKADTAQLKQLLTQLRLQKKLPFSYDIDFMEVFVAPDDEADRGFDLVIGNPPYVKESEILPAEDGQYLERLLLDQNKALRATENKRIKGELNAKIYATYPFLKASVTAGPGPKKFVYGDKIPGKTDLYGYFQLLVPALLNDRGFVCFIISNSWLDVGFGGYIQHFLLKHTKLAAFYDCANRSFDAAVNTIIYLHGGLLHTTSHYNGKGNGLSRSGQQINYLTLAPSAAPVKFFKNKFDYTLAAYAPLLLEQERTALTSFNDYFQVVVSNRAQLYQDGLNEKTGLYKGEKWYSRHFKAPAIVSKLQQHSKLAPLRTFGKIKLGMTSCQNDFFYPSREVVGSFQIEPEFLHPLFKSPQDSKRILNPKQKLKSQVLLCAKTPDLLKGTNMLRYLQHGETQRVSEVACLQGRNLWYNIGKAETSKIIIPYSYGDSFKAFYCPEGCYADKRLVQFLPGEHTKGWALYLNSTIWALMLESYGSSNLGEGALVFNTADFGVLFVCGAVVPTLNAFEQADGFITREIGSIFTELGFDRTLPIRQQQPAPLPDRAALDTLIFEALGLSAAERQEVYWAVAELVQQRLSKAASR